ncbi:D-alanyl-D-alanine carboxypeptidase/D-alanyl-D-alanine-endopeptidase [Dinoroseobacter sp. PD6]|nr:D-alanyl-D-alanine carboxypeptidase/D-alanyl-D-alanine-endopeptidase [Dinoroseobacter sp. PD6]MDD9716541.1 D-alanyl-D-alanine carboxypeptidase/D-alanyl-D-alanine-endopeptidase [Dinoroseobacter sp. PD6]
MSGARTTKGRVIDRRTLLTGLAAQAALWPVAARALGSSPHPAPRPEGLWRRAVPEAERLLQSAGLGGQTSFAVIDLRSGLALESVAGQTPLPPASVAKAATALYGLRVLGPEHRYTTRLLATGPIRAGRLDGDLILAGSGDPSLDTAALARLARLLRAAGVSEVTGALRVQADALPAIRSIDPGQPDHLGYSPAIAGLNLNFNRVYFEWKRQGSDYAVTMDARTGDLRPQVRVSSMSVQPRDLPIYTYEQRGEADHWTVARGALGAEGGRWLPVRNPAAYAADVFRTLCGAQGIRVTLGAPVTALPETATLIASHDSETLPGLLRGMLKYSTNITAECIGLTASNALGARPDSLEASGAQMAAWHGAQLMEAGPIRFADHSGLGDRSRISSLDMARLLSTHGTRTALTPLLKPYLPRDASGARMTDAPAQVVAKTGTLNFVSGLAGYITPPSGRALAFAIFSADMDRRAALSRAERERPEGGRAWARRARRLQNDLVLRWSRLYGA